MNLEALTGLYLVVIGIGLTEAIKFLVSQPAPPKSYKKLEGREFIFNCVFPFTGYLAIVLQFTLGTFITLHDGSSSFLLLREIALFLSGVTIAFMGICLSTYDKRYFFICILCLFLVDWFALLPKSPYPPIETLVQGVFAPRYQLSSTYAWWSSSNLYVLVFYGIWCLVAKFINLTGRNHFVLSLILIIVCILNFIENIQSFMQV